MNTIKANLCIDLDQEYHLPDLSNFLLKSHSFCPMVYKIKNRHATLCKNLSY